VLLFAGVMVTAFRRRDEEEMGTLPTGNEP
jgi:hypothetical protein